MKLQMIQSLKKPAIDYKDKAVSEQNLVSFISMKSRNFFENLSLSTSLIQIDPSNRNKYHDYSIAVHCKIYNFRCNFIKFST